MLLSHTLTMRRSDIARLVEFRLMVLGNNVTDRSTDDGCKDGRTEKGVPLAHPYHEEK